MKIICYILYTLCILMLLLSCHYTLKNGKTENSLNIKKNKKENRWTEEDERMLTGSRQKRKKYLSICIFFLIFQFSLLTVIAYL